MKRLFLNNFWLKIIAIIAMTIAHVGLFMGYFVEGFAATHAYFWLQAVGKMAFPIFIFLLIEGLEHTRSKKNYLIRLGSSALLIYFAELVINLPFFTSKYMMGGIERAGNIFLDLFLLALTYCFLTAKDKKKRYYMAIPIGIITIMSIIKIYDSFTAGAFPYSYLFAGLYLQYDFAGLLILFGFYSFYKLNDYQIKKALKDETLIETFKQTDDYQFRKNVFASISIVIVSAICYLVNIIPIEGLSLYCDFAILSYVALAGLVLLWYNGKLGFKNKYIQGAFYLYYPLHLAIIFLIFCLI